MANPNTFGAFLEALDAKPATKFSKEGPLALLTTLSAASTGTPVQDLMSRLGVDVFEFAQTVSGMKDAGLIQITGTGQNQVAALTPSGAALVKLATSK